MCGTTKITLGQNAKKNAQLNFYKTTALPCLMYGSETWTLRGTDEGRLEVAGMRFVQHVVGNNILREKKRSNGMRSQLRTMKFDKQIHKEGRKTGWNIYRVCLRKSSQATVILSTDRKT
jgi:hypothetical protein